MAPRLELLDQLSAPQVEAVLALRDTVAGRDGSSPLSDHVVVGLQDRISARQHVLAWVEDELAGYASVEPTGSAELVAGSDVVIDPMLEELSRLAGPELSLWARGEASVLASELPGRGFEATRVLLQMRRSLELPLPDPVWPAEVVIRTFVVGRDEAAWVAVNNLAFADHPDQSGWTVDDLVARQRETWFDPAGFFLAERDGELVGFHWTKIHPNRGGADRPIGEVYVIGVAPVMQGHRLGAALTVHGLAYLAGRGLPDVMLYVDESNTGAVALYEKIGFTRWDADRCFKRSTFA